MSGSRGQLASDCCGRIRQPGRPPAYPPPHPTVVNSQIARGQPIQSRGPVLAHAVSGDCLDRAQLSGPVRQAAPVQPGDDHAQVAEEAPQDGLVDIGGIMGRPRITAMENANREVLAMRGLRRRTPTGSDRLRNPLAKPVVTRLAPQGSRLRAAHPFPAEPTLESRPSVLHRGCG